MTSEPKNRYLITGATIDGDALSRRQLSVTLVATGPFDTGEVRALTNGGQEVTIVPVEPISTDQPSDDEWQPFTIPTTDGRTVSGQSRRVGNVVTWRMNDASPTETEQFARPNQSTHPTTTVTAKVTCVLVDDDGFEITVEDTAHTDRYHAKSWRFAVADASNYPVGSTIELEVPA